MLLEDKTFSFKTIKHALDRGRDSSVGKSFTSHVGDTGSNTDGGLTLGHTNAWMREEEITFCKSHIASFSLTDWVHNDLKKTPKNMYWK